MTPAEPTRGADAVYAYYRNGGTRGDLYVHYKRGRIGVLRPSRTYANALAAWRAGRDAAAAELEQETKNESR